MNARRTSAAGVAPVPAAKSTITLRRRGVLAVAGTAVIAAASLGATATAYAKKGDDDARKDVRKSVACGTGHLKLKAKGESANRVEIEAEVDTNKAGQEWTVTLTNDGKVVWTGKRTTAGASGSFSVETTIDPDAPAVTPTESPTATTSSSSTTTSSSSTTTSSTPSSDDSSSTANPSPTSSDDSSSTANPSSTASPTTSDDKGGAKGLRAAGSKGADDKKPDDKGGKGGDDKKGDDKGGDNKGKPATGKHLIGVTATLDTLTCATDLTY